MPKYVALFQHLTDHVDWEAEVIEADCWHDAKEIADSLKPSYHCPVVFNPNYGLDLPLHKLIAEYYEYELRSFMLNQEWGWGRSLKQPRQQDSDLFRS